MRIGRFVIAVFTLFLIALLWNGLVHMVLLQEHNAMIASLRRPDMADYWWLSIAMTLALITLFVYGYRQPQRRNSLRSLFRPPGRSTGRP